MKLQFDLESIDQVEFRIAITTASLPDFYLVSVNAGVRQLLGDILRDTWNRMNTIRSDPQEFDPGDDFPNTSYFYLPFDHDLAEQFRHIYNYGNTHPITNALDMFSKMSMYAIKFVDTTGRVLYGVKKTANARSRLRKPRKLRFEGPGLAMDDSEEFQLYPDFDFLIDAEHVLVYRHVGFEDLGKIVNVIKASAIKNLIAIQSDMAFVDFGNLTSLTTRGKTPAKLLASIRAKNHAKTLTREYLIRHCDDRQVSYTIVEDLIIPDIDPEQGLELLRVINRRYTHFEASEVRRETYLSASREEV